MEAGRSCLHRPSTGRKAPHFTNLSYQLLSSTGMTTYLSQQKVHLGKSIFSKSSPLLLAASALEKNLTNAIYWSTLPYTHCAGVDELVISKVLLIGTCCFSGYERKIVHVVSLTL